MADITGNPIVRKMQLQVRVSELELNLQRMDLRKFELEDEKARIDANIEATKKALEDLKKELGGN